MQPDIEPVFSMAPSVTDIDWSPPDMGVLSEGRRPPPKFPLEAFCPFWRNWLTVSAECASAPVDYVAAGLLVGAASLIGRARSARPWSGWAEPSILWLSIIGAPSSGKTPALQGPLSILRKLEAERGQDYPELLRQFEVEKESAQASKDAWREEVKTAIKKKNPLPEMPETANQPERPQTPRLLVNDATPEALGNILSNEPKGVLSLRDELAGWIGSFDRYSTGSGRQFWLEAYQGNPFIIDRVKNENGPIVVPSLSVSVLGGIQPDRLASAFLKGDDDGLVSRFLNVWPDAIPPNRPSKEANNTEAQTSLRRLMVLQMGSDEYGDLHPVQVPFSDDAATILDEFRQTLFQRTQLASGLLAGHLGKMPGAVCRLALVLTYLDWAASNDPEPQKIHARHVALACHMIEDYFIPMAERAFGDAALPLAERDAATIARRIIGDGLTEINERDIYREWGVVGLNRNRDRVRAAMTVLEDVNWTRAITQNETPGRKRRDHRINPGVFK
jgi:hypothetical protein